MMQSHAAVLMLAAVAAAGQTGQPMRLSLPDAVKVALAPEGSTRVQLARELSRQAETRSGQARAALLPNLDAAISYQSATRNLAAMGIRVELPIPGFAFPTFVGPYTVFDSRLNLTQALFDFAAIRRYQAARTGLEAARAEDQWARDEVSEQVARAYLAVLRAQAAEETGRANVALAQALLDLARSQKAAGTGTGIEVTRAQVQLANERQRLLVVETELDRTRRQFLRLLGLKLDTAFELTDNMGYLPTDPVTVEKAIEIARAGRADLKAQERRQESARLSYSATRGERLPAVVGLADYGSIGTGIDSARPTRSYGVSVRIPLWDGGRRDERRAESLSQLRAERIRTRDLEQQIELEVRLALESLRSSESQVKTAEEGLSLAGNELAQARRRYQAGVTSSLEVTDAQTRLVRARENRIAALFNYNLAQIELYASMGAIQKEIQRKEK